MNYEHWRDANVNLKTIVKTPNWKSHFLQYTFNIVIPNTIY